MTTDIKKDRSPNYPRFALQHALSQVNILYKKAGKAKMNPEAAVRAWDYTSLNGAALTTLGTLTAYGLLDRERGVGLSVSPLAITIIHPIDKHQERMNKAQSALLPKVFEELYSQGFRDADVSIICNHLIQKGFTPEGAAIASAVYVENFRFAELEEFRSNADMIKAKGIETMADIAARTSQIERSTAGTFQDAPVSHDQSVTQEYLKNIQTKTLAKYSFPIGANEVTITIQGSTLDAEDFDALGEQVVFFKKQFERKQKSDQTKSA